MNCTEAGQEDEDYKIALTKSEQLQALLCKIFETPDPDPGGRALQDLAEELSSDILYAVRRLR